MDWLEMVGLAGSVLSSITFIPQVYQTWKTKSVGDLNLTMMLIVLLSTIVWLVYGIGLALRPVIIANGIICILSILLIYFKFRYAQK
ncbi:MAG: SemiSWEET family transporter [Bacteroidota bacterium]|nr:SemiSWEET family transporter [Ferruginibacter sp.]